MGISDIERSSYSYLLALIKKQKLLIEQYCSDIGNAKNAISSISSGIAEIKEGIADGTSKLEKQQSSGSLLLPGRIELIKSYIQHKSQELEQKEKDKKQAEEVLKQLLVEYEQHNNRLQSMKDILRSRETELRQSKIKSEMLEMDDLWAQREFIS